MSKTTEKEVITMIQKTIPMMDRQRFSEEEELTLVGREEAQRLLNMSNATMTRFISSGELPSIKIGRSRRIRVSDIRRFIEEHYD